MNSHCNIKLAQEMNLIWISIKLLFLFADAGLLLNMWNS